MTLIFGIKKSLKKLIKNLIFLESFETIQVFVKKIPVWIKI